MVVFWQQIITKRKQSQDAGLSPKDTQELMGHADIETTLDIYTHIQRSRVEKSYKKLEKYVVKKSDDTSLKLVPSVRVEMRFVIPLSRVSLY